MPEQIPDQYGQPHPPLPREVSPPENPLDQNPAADTVLIVPDSQLEVVEEAAGEIPEVAEPLPEDDNEALTSTINEAARGGEENLNQLAEVLANKRQ